MRVRASTYELEGGGRGKRHNYSVHDQGTEREGGKRTLMERKASSKTAKGAAFLEHHAVGFASKAHKE